MEAGISGISASDKARSVNSPWGAHPGGARRRWLAFGTDVAEFDHGFCTSLYARDPNGILVEWCLGTRALGAQDRAEAERRLFDPSPELDPTPATRVHRARDFRG
jgi:hypothetical protein